MIERREVNGKPATVAYLAHDPNGGFRSVSPEECDLVEVRFDDGGVLFGTRDRSASEDKPRNDHGGGLATVGEGGVKRLDINAARVFSYVVKSDTGFAPNPYGGFLTLATCKPHIRTTAREGDWLLGTSSVVSGDARRIVYAAHIEEVVPLEEYGRRKRFAIKIPRVSGEKWQRHGDNIYFRDAEGAWQQRRNVHHFRQHKEHDLSGKSALICPSFWYFGSNGPLLPESLIALLKKGPGHKTVAEPHFVARFEKWLAGLRPPTVRTTH